MCGWWRAGHRWAASRRWELDPGLCASLAELGALPGRLQAGAGKPNAGLRTSFADTETLPALPQAGAGKLQEELSTAVAQEQLLLSKSQDALAALKAAGAAAGVDALLEVGGCGWESFCASPFGGAA